MSDSALISEVENELTFWTDHFNNLSRQIERNNAAIKEFAKQKYQRQSELDVLMGKSNNLFYEKDNVEDTLKELKSSLESIKKI